MIRPGARMAKTGHEFNKDRAIASTDLHELQIDINMISSKPDLISLSRSLLHVYSNIIACNNNVIICIIL